MEQEHTGKTEIGRFDRVDQELVKFFEFPATPQTIRSFEVRFIVLKVVDRLAYRIGTFARYLSTDSVFSVLSCSINLVPRQKAQESSLTRRITTGRKLKVSGASAKTLKFRPVSIRFM